MSLYAVLDIEYILVLFQIIAAVPLLFENKPNSSCFSSQYCVLRYIAVPLVTKI